MKIVSNDIEAKNLANRYLKGQLSPDEIVAFEEYILDKPELLEQLELDSILIETLPKIEESRVKPSLFSTFYASWRVLLPTACSLVLFVLLLLNSNPEIHETTSQIHYVENVRSASQDRTESIKIEADTGVLVLVVTPLVLSDMHEVILSNANGLLYSKQQKLSEFGQLSILIDKSIIDSGKATLKVIPATRSHTESDELMEIELVFEPNDKQSLSND